MARRDCMAVKARVKRILETDVRSRNSDSFLYFKVLEEQGREKGLDIHSMSMPTFLLNMAEYGFAPFESVRRARQKVQEKHPELAACATVQENRKAQEREYREFARS